MPACSGEVHETLLRRLLGSNSWLAIVVVKDLLGTAQRFDVPGNVSDFNWSARMTKPWGALSGDEATSASRI